MKVSAPDNIQTNISSFTEINNNALLELSFYIYGGTRKKQNREFIIGSMIEILIIRNLKMNLIKSLEKT